MTTKRKQLILAWYDLIPPEDVDGIWGKQSKAATKKLQGALGIEQDGDFGPTTAAEVWNAIFDGRELDFDDVTDINVVNKSDKDTNVPTKTGTFCMSPLLTAMYMLPTRIPRAGPCILSDSKTTGMERIT